MSNKKSNSSLIKINKFTPLLTDVLPYETPLSFSNNSFYAKFKKAYDENAKKNYKNKAQGKKYEEISAEDFFKKYYLPPFLHSFFEGKKIETTIPYKYNIQKNVSSF